MACFKIDEQHAHSIIQMNIAEGIIVEIVAREIGEDKRAIAIRVY